MASADGEVKRLCRRILEQLAVPKKLRGVLPPITRVTIDAKDRSVKEVLEEFQRQTRIPMKLRRAGESSITVRIQDAGPLEALNAICRAAKLGWDYPSEGFIRPMEPVARTEPRVPLLEGPEIQFTPGHYAERPRLFIRHYEVEFHEIVLSRTNDFRNERSRGELSIGLFWPHGVKPYSVIVEVTSAIDNRGNQLLEGHDDPRQPKGPREEFAWWGNPLRLYDRYRLRYPDKGVRALASVRGSARIFYLLREKMVIFESPEKSVGVRKEIEGVTVELVELKTVELKPGETYLKARVQIKGREWMFPPRARARLENGKMSGPLRAVPIGNPAASLYDFNLYDPSSKPVAFEVVAESICGEDAFDFEFKDVVLP